MAAALLMICDPFFLFSRGAKNDQAPAAESLPEERESPRFPRQTAALGRMKNEVGLGERIHEVLQITAGRRGTTLMWSQLANTIEQEFGPNWLSIRIVVSAASNTALTRGIASRAGDANRTAFGNNMAASSLLGALLTGRCDESWWRDSARSLETPLDVEAWLLALITCADEDTILTMLDEAAALIATLPPAAMKKIGMASKDIARTSVTRSPYTVAVAAKVSPRLAALMLPLCHVGALGFDADAIDQISTDNFLLATYVNAYWAVREAGSPVTEEELQLIASCGPNYHLRAKALDYEKHVAEYILSEPELYPTVVLVRADEAMSAGLKIPPLKEVAEREEWFIVPE